MPARVLPEEERVTAGDDFGGERATARLTERRRREWVRDSVRDERKKEGKAIQKNKHDPAFGVIFWYLWMLIILYMYIFFHTSISVKWTLIIYYQRRLWESTLIILYIIFLFFIRVLASTLVDADSPIFLYFYFLFLIRV